MKHLNIFFATLALTVIALFPATVRADDELDDLDVTMEVLDNVGALGDEISEMDGPGDDDFSEHDEFDDPDDLEEERDEQRDREDDEEEDRERDEERDRRPSAARYWPLSNTWIVPAPSRCR